MAWISSYFNYTNDFVPASTAHLRQVFVCDSTLDSDSRKAVADAVVVFVNLFLAENGFGLMSKACNASVFPSSDGTLTIDFLLAFTSNTSASDAYAVVNK